MEEVDIKEFMKIDLRVGEIKAVKDHPNADKLYILLVDMGPLQSDFQIVSGLRMDYKKEDLLGRQIIVIRNLKPSVIRGVESNGMLLAAVHKGKVVLLKPDKKIEKPYDKKLAKKYLTNVWKLTTETNSRKPSRRYDTNHI